eukprot:2755184-Rhodomonas_salina.1
MRPASCEKRARLCAVPVSSPLAAFAYRCGMQCGVVHAWSAMCGADVRSDVPASGAVRDAQAELRAHQPEGAVRHLPQHRLRNSLQEDAGQLCAMMTMMVRNDYDQVMIKTMTGYAPIEDVGTERDNIVVKAPDFFHKLNDFFDKHSPESLIPYLRWHLVSARSRSLATLDLRRRVRIDLPNLAFARSHTLTHLEASSMQRQRVRLALSCVAHGSVLCLRRARDVDAGVQPVAAALAGLPGRDAKGGREPDGDQQAAGALAQVCGGQQSRAPDGGRPPLHRALLLGARPPDRAHHARLHPRRLQGRPREGCVDERGEPHRGPREAPQHLLRVRPPDRVGRV